MTGTPLLRLGLVLLGLLVLAYPLARLTSKAATPPSTPPTATPPALEPRSVTLTITATSRPTRLEVALPGEATATRTNPTLTSEIPLTLPPSTQGWDLIIRATWPNADPHALRVTTDQIDQTFWVHAELEEVLTLPPSPELPTPRAKP